VVPLGEIADLQAGVGFPPDLQGRTSGDYPVAKVGDISRVGRTGEAVINTADHFVDDIDLVRLRARPIPVGSVLFAKIGEAIRQNHRVIAGCELLVDNNAMAAIPTERVESRYLFHFLRTVDFYALASATTVPALRKSDLQRLPVPLPPLPEQRRIAEILDKADALRAKRRAALAQLDTLTQSIFLDMFGDPATNPRGFPIAHMGDVCDVRDGTHDSPKYISDGGYPLVTSKNVTGGVVDLTDVNYISEADYVQINKRSKVDRGDIILPMIGTIGSPVLVDHEPCYAIKNVALIKFVKASPSAVFVRHLLSGHYFDYIVSRKNRGGTQKFVSLGDLRAFPLPLPSKNEQQEFARRVEAVEKARTISRTSEAELDALFGSLQHRAFRGEL
jgi:type I restriction enzyme S subunit